MTIRPRDKIALAVVLVLAAVFGYYKFAFTPARHQVSSLDGQLKTARASLSQAEQKYAAGRAAASELTSSEQGWAAIERAVPQSSDIPALLRLLQRSSGGAHVSMQGITLSGSTSTTSSSSATASGSTSSAGVTAVPISLTFNGGYAALNHLVTRLDDLVSVTGKGVRASGPLINISNITLNPGEHQLTVQISADIYQHAAASTVLGSALEGSS